MTDKKSATADIAVEKELEGVPEHMKDETPEATDAADAKIAALEEALAAAQQDVLYAQAETQNVRRRMEKEAQDARAYAATGFARDILSVSDNLSRALEAIPAEMRESEAKKVIPDYDQVISNYKGQAPKDHVAAIILESDKSALLKYHFASNPRKLAEINSMSPLSAAREIGRLEASLSSPK
jgi:molecular chaperone GrpE (heat shock protein)